jgi:hypothetical protein
LLSGSNSSTSTDPTTSTTATTSATTTASTAKTTSAQSFADTLKAHGVDFQQFRADLVAAVKSAQNGQVNPGTALKSFAPGSALNLTA